MKKCKKCNRDTENEIPLLQVKTLHIRSFGGEKQIQALGDIKVEGICRECVEKYRKSILNPNAHILKIAALCILMMLSGIALAVLSDDRVFKLPAIGAIVCGGLIMYTDIKSTLDKRNNVRNMTEEESFHNLSTELLKRYMPKKSEDADLTYIGIEPGMRNAKLDTMVLKYDLLPEIAKKALVVIKQYYDKA